MLSVDLLGWWYLRGWTWVAQHFFVTRTLKILHFFSVVDLLKTLFAPFRQDSLNTKGAPIGIKLQAFGMNIISRIFGFFIRVALITIGLVFALSNVLAALIVVVSWPLLPISPIVAIVLILLSVGVEGV